LNRSVSVRETPSFLSCIFMKWAATFGWQDGMLTTGKRPLFSASDTYWSVCVW